MKKIGEGFFEIAQSADRVKEKKLYKQLGFNTFEIFCKEVLGLTRKTVYLYLRIAEKAVKYPDLFESEKVVLFGSKKMDIIIAGVNKVELKKRSKANAVIKKMMKELNTNKTTGEVESIVMKYTKNL
jgi:hypothetical protein